MIKKKDPVAKPDEGNQLIINGEAVKLTKIEGRPVFFPVKRPRTLDPEPEPVWYTAHAEGVDWYLTNSSVIKLGALHVRQVMPGSSKNAIMFNNCNFDIGFFGVSGHKSYLKVRMKAEHLYHHDKMDVANSSITSKEVRLEGEGKIYKSHISTSERVCIIGADVRGFECTDFAGLELRNSYIGSWDNTLMCVVNCDGEPGGYYLIVDGPTLTTETFGGFYPSIPGKFVIRHRAHFGTFTGISPVRFVRMSDDSILLDGHIQVSKKEVKAVLESLTDNALLQQSPAKLQLWRAFATDHRLVPEMPDQLTGQFRTFLRSVLSRIELFGMLSVLNK